MPFISPFKSPKGTSLDYKPTASDLTDSSEAPGGGPVESSQGGGSAAPAPAKPMLLDAEGKKVICDKCDGNHLTDDCPYFKKTRDEHPDAKARPGLGATGLGNSGGNFHFKVAEVRVIRQPPDGACLFHSLSHGINQPAINADSLRRKICSWIGSHPNEVIAGSSVKEWVLWDTNKTVSAYVARMSKPGCWGGGIEMAACSRLFNINVHVYEIDRPEGEAPRFKRISCFNAAELAKEAKEAKEAAKGKAEIVAASTWSRPRSPRSLSPRTPRSSRFATPTKPGLGGARPGAGPSSRPEVSRVGSKRGTSGSGSGNGGGRPSNSARPSAEEPPGGTTKDQPAGVAPVPLGTAAATIAAVVGAADPSAVDAAGGATSLPEAAAAAAAAEVDNYPTVHVLYGGGIHFDVLLPGRDGKASSLRSSSTSGGALEARSPRLPSALGAAPRSPRPSPPPGGGTGPPGSGLHTPIRKPRLPASSLSARPLPSVRVPLGSRAASGSVSNSPRKPASTPKISGSGGGEASADAGRALLATGLSVPVSPIKPSGAQSRIF